MENFYFLCLKKLSKTDNFLCFFFGYVFLMSYICNRLRDANNRKQIIYYYKPK